VARVAGTQQTGLLARFFWSSFERLHVGCHWREDGDAAVQGRWI